MNQNWLFSEEKNISEELVISEEEVTDIDTSTIKENNVEDLCKLIFIDEKSMRVVFHEGGGMESRKSDIKSVELPTYRC